MAWSRDWALRLRPNGSKAWIGHRRATTTNRYPHRDDATLNEAAERVPRVIQGKLLDL